MNQANTTAERTARFLAREQRARAERAHGDDVRAAARLVVDATQGVMGVVGRMQHTLSPPVVAQVSDLVNALVRASAGGVGLGIDAAIAALTPLLGASVPGRERDALVAALNGVAGDRLEAAGSPLAIPMGLRPPLDERRQGTLLLLLHGSSMSDRQWTVAGHDHGRALLEELERDVTLAYLHYNSGRHVKNNGEDLAALLEREHEGFDAVMIVAHSMGGLVARSAVAVAEGAGHAWRKKLKVLVTLGTPHHGSPLERAGNLFEALLGVTPWTKPLAVLGQVRSAGVTDLRYGNVVDADADRFAFAPDVRTPVPLPKDVLCCAVAATKTPTPASPPASDDFAALAALAGDNLVPVPSALGLHKDPARTLHFNEKHIAYGTHHVGLLASAEVLDLLRRWCA